MSLASPDGTIFLTAYESPNENIIEKIIEVAMKQYKDFLARIVAKNEENIQELLKEDSNS